MAVFNRFEVLRGHLPRAVFPRLEVAYGHPFKSGRFFSGRRG